MVPTNLSPSHLVLPLSSQPFCDILSHQTPRYTCALGFHQNVPDPLKLPMAPVERYFSVNDIPPGPGVSTAVPLPVPPLGIMGLGSDFSVTVQLPAIILIIFVISGAGLVIGMPICSFGLAAGLAALGFADIAESCAASGIQQSPPSTNNIVTRRMVLIGSPLMGSKFVRQESYTIRGV